MASTATPYGFRAVNELGGLPYAVARVSFSSTLRVTTPISSTEVLLRLTHRVILKLLLLLVRPALMFSRQAQSAFSSAAPT